MRAVKPRLMTLLAAGILLAGCGRVSGTSVPDQSAGDLPGAEDSVEEDLPAESEGASAEDQAPESEGESDEGGDTGRSGGGVESSRGKAAVRATQSVVFPNPATPPASLPALQAELESFLSQLPGTFGVAVVDLTTGEEMAIQGDQVFPAASTCKLPMAMFVLNEVAEGRANLDDMVAYQKEDWQDGTGLLQYNIKEGDQVSIGRLVELTITQSDNIAAMMLRRHFGPEKFAAYRRRMGETQLYWVDEDGTIYYGFTPRAMAQYLVALYRGEGIADPSLVKYLLNLLCHTAWNDRIDAGVPDEIPVAHKIGTLDGVINDVGLVLHPTRPYVLTFYSQGVTYDDGAAISEYVSRRVYAYFSSVAKTN